MTQEAFYASLPKKRMAAGVLFFNDDEQVLLVKMSYKEGWGIPGGAVEENESPRDGAIREVKEELNLDVHSNDLKLVCLGYVKTEGIKTESLQFTFYGGILSREKIAEISLPPEELTEFRFFAKDDALNHLSNELLKERVAEAFDVIREGTFVYIDK